MLGAAQGLRQELALPPADAQGLPADRVAGAAGAGVSADPGVEDVGPRALAADDPTVLDQLLALPRVHLVVDGYNVTKSGYGDARAGPATGPAGRRARRAWRPAPGPR